MTEPQLLDLATPAGRRRGLDLLVRGIPLVNAALGVSLPLPVLDRWQPSVLDDDALADPDVYYLALLAAMLDVPALRGGDRLVLPPEVAAWSAEAVRLAPGEATVLTLGTASDAALIDEARRRFRVTPVEPFGGIDDHDLLFTKLNHRFWETIASNAMRSAGLEYVRPLGTSGRWRDSRITEVVLTAIDRLHRSNLDRGAPNGSVSMDRRWLGVSLSNGETSVEQELREPLAAVARGAIIGMTLGFAAIAEGPTWQLAEGSLAKGLFWSRELEGLLSRIASRSDRLLVIGPPHLARTGFRDRDLPVDRLVVPGTLIHPLWPAVVAVAMGTLDVLVEEGVSLSVLVQGAVTGALIGVTVMLWRDVSTRGVVRYLDLGQVLDVAAPGDPRRGGWLRRIGPVDPSVLTQV